MLWSLHAPFLSLVLQGTPEPSSALFLSHLKIVCSGSATLDLATAHTRLSSARGLKYWTWRLHCCFAGTGHQYVLDLLWISFGIFWIICTYRTLLLQGVPFQERSGVKTHRDNLEVQQLEVDKMEDVSVCVHPSRCPELDDPFCSCASLRCLADFFNFAVICPQCCIVISGVYADAGSTRMCSSCLWFASFSFASTSSKAHTSNVPMFVSSSNWTCRS